MIQLIGTWKMSLDGVREGAQLLSEGGSAGDAVERAIVRVEDNPEYTSVGYGGLPDRDGHKTVDVDDLHRLG